MQRCAEKIIAHFPILPPTILRHLNPARQRPFHRHTNPHSSPHHRPQPERRQHQKHRPHHQINNHIILRILDPCEIPATVGIAAVEYIQKPAIEPPCQFPLERQEKQRKQQKLQRHYCLNVSGRTQRYQRNTNHQRHSQQRLAHAVECRERRYATRIFPALDVCRVATLATVSSTLPP